MRKSPIRKKTTDSENEDEKDDDGFLQIALQQLHARLIAAQPAFTEEDVIIMPYPSPGGSPTHSLVSSPRDWESVEENEESSSWMMTTTTSTSTTSTANNNNNNNNNNNKESQKNNSVSVSSVGTRSAALRSAGPSASSSQEDVVNLDAQLTSRQFLTVVRKFDAKSVLRNRKAAADALKLLNHAYSLTWRDTEYLAKATRRGRVVSSRSITSSTTRDINRRGGVSSISSSGNSGNNSSSSSSNNRSSNNNNITNTTNTKEISSRSTSTTPPPPPARHNPFLLSSFTIPTYKPKKGLILVLSKCVETFLVYANESPSLRTMITSNMSLLGMLCFVCGEARKQEVSSSEKELRDIETELSELASYWQSFQVTIPFLESLQECYLIEFLLDVALPPTVCSSKYDGITMMLYQKKERLMMDIVSGRAGVNAMTKGLPLRGLAALVSMSSFAEPKLRARALDKMAGEGLVLTLRDELCSIAKDTIRMSTSLRSNNRVSPPKKKKDISPAPLRVGVKGVHEISSLSPSSFSSPQLRVKRLRGEGIWLGMQDSPARRLGYCLDVLQWLTAPNLLTQDVCTNTKAVVRATAWASRTEDLRDICTSILRLSLNNKSIIQYSHPHPLQEQALECVRQIANYSAVLYGVVVDALDCIIDEYRRKKIEGQDDFAASLLPLMVELLRLKQHAEANEESVCRWFTFLTECLVPQAFDVPVITCGGDNNTNNNNNNNINIADSTDKNSNNNSKSRGNSRNRSSSRGGGGGRRRSSNPRREAPILARDLRRDEILSLSPYFRFACRIISETTWRQKAEPFFARIALLAYHVILTQARRPNLIFGQASACYDAVAPLLETPYGVLPGECCVSVGRSASVGSMNSPSSPNSPNKNKNNNNNNNNNNSGSGIRGNSSSSSTLFCTPVRGRSSCDEVEVFVPSPSNSPLFLEAYSPSDVNSSSPTCGVTTSSWRRRLSLSAFLAAIGECYNA